MSTLSFTQLLRSQVMFPNAIGEDYLGIKLSNSRNYHRWCSDIEDHIMDISSEWYEYFTTGVINSVNVDATELIMVVRILERATILLINNTIKGEAKEAVRNLVDNSSTKVTSQDIRLTLEQDFGTVSVADNLELLMKCLSFKPTTSVTEKRQWSKYMSNIFMEYTNNVETYLPNLTLQERQLLAAKRNKASDYQTALFYMFCSPELISVFKDKFKGKTTVTTKEVDDIMENMFTYRYYQEVSDLAYINLFIC